MSNSEKLSILRTAMAKAGVAAAIIPSNDEFMNEYVPAYARRLEWLTGFSGSAGMALVLEDRAAFFTDGRYMLQAAQQLPQNQYEVLNTGDIKPLAWLVKNLKPSGIIAMNSMLHTKDNVAVYQSIASVELCDLIENIWHDRPQKPTSVIKLHPLEYTGVSHTAKISQITTKMKEHGADTLLLSAPDSVCWLLNIRGTDVPNTPLVLARLLLNSDGGGTLFVDSNGVLPLLQSSGDSLDDGTWKNIKLAPLSSIPEYLSKITSKKILLDKSSTPYLFFDLLSKNNSIIESSDPCTLPKACKNTIEIAGAINAHIRDGRAVTAFLSWLQENYKSQKITEISLADKLLEFRKKDPLFKEPSFDTIAGFGSNGAIVHYRASDESNKKIAGNNLLLLDSGGQYLGGTTDITRTVAIGTPTAEQKHNFTLVLKGHIAIATCIFPEGTTGHQIDILARQYLWQHGLDYDHGTGHGVGSFLGVHEGPQRISKAINEVALMPGMIISNEPGYYKAGEYGIRIENLVVVEDSGMKSPSGKRFLKFRTITCVAIDLNLVDWDLLTQQEKQWLQNYHKEVSEKLLTA